MAIFVWYTFSMRETLKQNEPGAAAVYQELTVRDALAVLALKYSRRKTALIRNGLRITVEEALDRWPSVLLDANCQESGDVCFHGGPPGRARWFTGSIHTLLSDAVLFYQHTRGRSATELLSL